MRYWERRLKPKCERQDFHKS